MSDKTKKPHTHGGKTPAPAVARTASAGTMIWGDEPGANSVPTSRAGEVAECGDSTEPGDPVTDCQAAILGL